MKKTLILVCILLCFCFSGCSNTYAKEEYDSFEKLTSQGDRYSKEGSVFNPIEGGYSFTVSKFDGRQTLFTWHLAEDEDLTMEIICSLTDGNGKLVHVDADGNVTLENDRVDSVFLVKSQRHITVDELFSESYLYGDYTMLNQFLVKKYGMKLLEETPVNDPIFQTNQDDQNAILDALEKFLTDSTGSTEMNVFTVESLEQALEKYAFGFSQWVEGVRTLLA
jgi:hypothetical protein